MKERQRYSGIYPIMWAFFDEMGKLDEKAMRLQVSTCIETGAHGITILGLVTEMNKLSRDERQQIVEWAGDEIGGRVPLTVTVPEPSIPGTGNLRFRALVDIQRARTNFSLKWV